MKIKQWAFLTAGMYALSLVVLLLPLFAVAFTDSPAGHQTSKKTSLTRKNEFGELAELYKLPHYWACVGILTVLEGVLLLIPIQVSRERPVQRGSWIGLAVTAGLMMGLLLYGLGFGILEAMYLDKVPDESLSIILRVGLLGWVIWGVIFFIYSVRNETTAFSKTVDSLFVGSVAELLVAVPCHVYVRQQEYCCAGFGTFLGIATGLAVLLFAFGPGVFFLFVKRARRLRAAKEIGQAPASAPALSGFLRRATFWGLGALLLALIPVALQFVPKFNTKEVWVVFRAGFVHAAAIACIYAWIALRKKEARGTWVFAGLAILAEMALLQAWLLTRYPI